MLLTQSDRILRLDPPGGGFFGPPTSSTSPVLAVDVPPGADAVVERAAVYPNPFESETRVKFALANEGVVDVSVYDVAGRLTRTLFSGNLPGGAHDIPWNGLDSEGAKVKAGVYFIRVRSGGQLLNVRTVNVR